MKESSISFWEEIWEKDLLILWEGKINFNGMTGRYLEKDK